MIIAIEVLGGIVKPQSWGSGGCRVSGMVPFERVLVTIVTFPLRKQQTSSIYIIILISVLFFANTEKLWLTIHYKQQYDIVITTTTNVNVCTITYLYNINNKCNKDLIFDIYSKQMQKTACTGCTYIHSQIQNITDKSYRVKSSLVEY